MRNEARSEAGIGGSLWSSVVRVVTVGAILGLALVALAQVVAGRL